MGITRSEQEGEPEQIHEQSRGDLYRTPDKKTATGAGGGREGGDEEDLKK